MYIDSTCNKYNPIQLTSYLKLSPEQVQDIVFVPREVFGYHFPTFTCCFRCARYKLELCTKTLETLENMGQFPPQPKKTAGEKQTTADCVCYCWLAWMFLR